MATGSAHTDRLAHEKRIGAGLTAEVFSWGERHVLKLFFEWMPRASVDREFVSSQAIHRIGVSAPAAVEIIEAGGRSGILFERIRGQSLLRQVERKPWSLFEGAKRLAELHASIHRCKAPLELGTQKEQLQRWVDSTESIEAAERETTRQQIQRLPMGDVLCHGDFHPGNILLAPQGPVIIDWATASRGDALVDVARTSALFERAKLPADSPWHTRLLMKVARQLLHMTYLRKYLQLAPGSMKEIESCREAQRAAGAAWRAGHLARLKTQRPPADL